MAEKEVYIPEHYGNKISTVDNEGKRKWVYAFQPKGKYYKYRTWLSWLYYAIFFTLPFIKINGIPFLMLNIPKGEFSIFGKMFFPQDFIILGIGMVLGVVFIYVFTLIFGRVFCGWICPQTIFMEMMFRKIEFWIEGPAHKQMQIARKKEKSTDYYIRKIIKHIIFFTLSFIISNTFLAYIIGVDEVFRIATEPVSMHIIGFISILIFTIIFYTVFAFIREIVCTVICPYGRLQSVLMDKKSKAVVYDYNRGEPRSKKRKDDTAKGDCIDCGMCVNVCHTGIDIRDGLQMECVGCTACMDACDDMMLRVGLPPKLITIASQHQLETNTVGQSSWDLRAKLLITLLAILTIGFTTIVLTRPIFDATLMRVPGQIYQEHDDGTVTNLYKIIIVSKSAKTLPFDMKVEENFAQIEYVTGKSYDSLQSGNNPQITFFVRVPSDKISSRKMHIHVQILSGDKVIQTKKVSFLSSY
ncbi:MAG: cytochrome c oxidase accessory protein CcoG [Brumimicrobium sp.]|nr:cytochrome c oxidase accessory protein CcoG [Brumimicrobium sp.]